MISALRRAWQAFTTRDADDSASDWRRWNARLMTLRAAYEAALPRNDLWTLADFKDADATLLPHIRRAIRSRTRYEYANNPLVARVVNVWVEDVLGDDSGPWLKVSSGHPQIDAFVEECWGRWWTASNQAHKLRTAIQAEATDGEAVGVLIRSLRILEGQRPNCAVSVDVAGLECDRLASPDWDNANRSDYIDGVHLDPGTREPIAYDLLKAHPGTEYLDQLQEMFEAETFPADEILHGYRRLRPEQHRGVSRYVSVLPTGGLHRKMVEAHVMREQIRAAFSFIIKSQAPPNDEEGPTNEDQWWQQINLPNRQGIGMFMPEGYDITQFKADSAASELEGFHRIIAGSVAGCFAMPLGRALGVYGTSGYAPIRAEMLPYHHTIASDRNQVWGPLWLRPLYNAWIAELQLTPGWYELLEQLDSRPTAIDLQNVAFCWPQKDLVVDPSREDESRRKRLAAGLTLREDEISAANLDEHDRRAARSFGFADNELGLREYRRMVAAAVHQVPGGLPEASGKSDDASTSAEE